MARQRNCGKCSVAQLFGWLINYYVENLFAIRFSHRSCIFEFSSVIGMHTFGIKVDYAISAIFNSKFLLSSFPRCVPCENIRDV